MKQLAKIHRRRWKERLKIIKVAKFESEMLKTNKDMYPQRRENLHTLIYSGWWHFVPVTIQTSVKFRDFAKLYLRSLLTYHFQTWQVY